MCVDGGLEDFLAAQPTTTTGCRRLGRCRRASPPLSSTVAGVPIHCYTTPLQAVTVTANTQYIVDIREMYHVFLSMSWAWLSGAADHTKARNGGATTGVRIFLVDGVDHAIFGVCGTEHRRLGTCHTELARL